MRISVATLALLLMALPGYPRERDNAFHPPQYNFSGYEVLVRKDVLDCGVCVVVFGGAEPYLNGFFAPVCQLTIGGRQVTVRNAIFLNIDVILQTNRSPDEVLMHELTHYRQYLRCGSAARYYEEWRRQQALPYWQRPWELEAHQAEKRSGDLLRLTGRKEASLVFIHFEPDRGRLADLPHCR